MSVFDELLASSCARRAKDEAKKGNVEAARQAASKAQVYGHSCHGLGGLASAVGARLAVEEAEAAARRRASVKTYNEK